MGGAPRPALAPVMALALLLLLPGAALADPASFTMAAGRLDFANCTVEPSGRCCLMAALGPPPAPHPRVVECIHREVQCSAVQCSAVQCSLQLDLGLERLY
jgi:hypothetical protein